MHPLSHRRYLRTRPARIRWNPDAEERYWREQTDMLALPRPGLRRLGSIAMTAGLFLLLVGIA